jgi:glycosyltransferase involved in cell wall biosynthesis
VQGDTFSPSSDATHPYGILYQGPWETLADGTCRAVRRHSRSLADTGVPVLLKSFNHTKVTNGIVQACYGDYDDQVLEDIGDIHHTSIGKFPLAIKHLVVNTPERLRGVLYPRGILGADPHQTRLWQAGVAQATVLYTVWERTQIPEEIAKIMSGAGQCWVPCHQNRDCLIKSGVPAEKVFVVPHPYLPHELERATKRSAEFHRGVTAGEKRFYAIGAWQPRKAFHELIGAFMQRFEPGTGITLRVKTTDVSWPNYPSPRESIMHWLEQSEVRRNGWSAEKLRGNLSVITKTVTDDQIQQMHVENDIYVCCSRGEAWSLPAFDAKLYGNRMVYVPWGGPVEFCDEQNDSPVSIGSEFSAVPSSYGWGDATWADFTIDALGEALQHAAWIGGIDDVYGVSRGNRDAFLKQFSSVTVGVLMRTLLRQLSEKTTPTGVRDEIWKLSDEGNNQ